LVPIPWEAAFDLVADLSRYVLDNYSELARGMNMYFYNYYENNCALTKPELAKINTPCWARHDEPASGADTPVASNRVKVSLTQQ